MQESEINNINDTRMKTGSNFLGILNDIKRRPEDAANELNMPLEEICAIISLGSERDTNHAVKAAKNSFLAWWDTSKEKKLELLNNLLNIYQKRSLDMAQAISLEMGAPKDWSINEQSQSGEDHIKTFINQFQNFEFENYFIFYIERTCLDFYLN